MLQSFNISNDICSFNRPDELLSIAKTEIRTLWLFIPSPTRDTIFYFYSLVPAHVCQAVSELLTLESGNMVEQEALHLSAIVENKI